MKHLWEMLYYCPRYPGAEQSFKHSDACEGFETPGILVTAGMLHFTVN